MTISSISNRVSYAGNGSTTAFAVPYPFFAEDELLVIVETDSDGSEDEQTLTTDYTVSGGEGSTGTVTMVTAPASGETLHIIRDTEAVQETDLVNNSAMDAETLEDVLDRRAMREQRLFEHIERALRVPETEAALARLPKADDRKGKVFAFDSSTGLVDLVDKADLGGGAASAGDVVGTLSALKATDVSGLSGGEVVYMSGRGTVGDGGQGWFAFRNSDKSTEVTADSEEGIWVPPDSDATGASGAWERLYNGALNLRWFGAVPGTGNDNTAALQGAHDMLPDEGGTIYIDAGDGSDTDFRCDSEVTFTKRVRLLGDGRRRSSLIYTGNSSSGPFITYGANDLAIDFLAVQGVAGGSGEYFVSGSIGVKGQGSLKTVAARLARFDTAVEYNGGFYHTFVETEFDRCSKFCDAFNANNVSFIGCALSRADTFLVYNGGVGPVSFTDCALELFIVACVDTTGGATASVNFDGCYIENSSATTGQLALGLSADAFDTGKVVLGSIRSLTMIGNYVNCNGIARVFTGTTAGAIFSLGNTVALTTDINRYFSANSVDAMEVNDYHNSGSTGTFSHVVITTFNNPDAVHIIDIETREDTSPQVGWTSLSLTNGWTDAAVGYDLAYRVTKGYVEVRGKVVGSSATGNIIATLPSGARPAENIGFAIIDDADAPLNLRVRATGEIENRTGGTPSAVHLHTIRFEQDG